MQKILIVFGLLLYFQSGSSQDVKISTKEALQAPKPTSIKVEKVKPVSWDKTTHDFGKIKQNKPVTVKFTVTNNGMEPLIIKDAKGSCGCTTADWSKEPIMPGKTTTIKTTYNASALGTFDKAVTVNTNLVPTPMILRVKGEVIK
jgi:hypothetical protein